MIDGVRVLLVFILELDILTVDQGLNLEMVSVSSKIVFHGGGGGREAAVAVVLLVLVMCGVLVVPSDASITDEPATHYKHAAPAPSPAPVIVVQGVIYCKSCKLHGYNRDMDASPLPNATAKLMCSYGNEKSGYRSLQMASTAADGNGYFLVMVYDVAMFRRSSSCKVYLRSSPTALCDAPFFPSSTAAGLAIVRTSEDDDHAKKKPHVVDVYSLRSALMYAPSRAGRCPH